MASKALAISLVIVLFFFSHLGGLLNRSRGGYLNFRKSAVNSSEDGLGMDYWSAEICKNLLFAIPTGLVVVSKRFKLNNFYVVYICREVTVSKYACRL